MSRTIDEAIDAQPEAVKQAIEAVIDRAGTSDSDFSVLLAAGEIIADANMRRCSSCSHWRRNPHPRFNDNVAVCGLHNSEYREQSYRGKALVTITCAPGIVMVTSGMFGCVSWAPLEER